MRHALVGAALMLLMLWAALSSLACARVCTTFAHRHFEVELIEPYNESSQFQYHPGTASLPYLASSCGDLELGDRQFLVETPEVSADCDLYYGTLTGLEEPRSRTTVEADRYLQSSALAIGSNQDIIAEHSRVTLGGVCPGFYTVVLRRTNLQEVEQADLLQAPVPGQIPPWVVVRSFEPQGACPMLGLAEHSGCSDVWAAHLTGLSHL